MKLRRRVRYAGVGIVKNIIRRYDETVFDRAHNSAADAAYNAIVSQYPDRRLAPATQRTIRDYSLTVFGSEKYQPWLKAYTAFRGSFHEGWLPDNYYGRYFAKGEINQYHCVERRAVAARFFQSELFPDLLYGINGGLYDRTFERVERADVGAIVFAEHDVAFLKHEGSAQGLGVSRIEKGRFDLDAAIRRGNFVIQRPVEQHPFFDRFSPGGAATIRLLTMRPNGGRPELRAAFLRGGRTSELIVRSARQVRIPVDMSSGGLGAEGTLSDWTRTDRHPDTGAVFAGETIPAFSRAVEACLALHDRVPHTPVTGWDVCITPAEEVRLFEVNARHPGLRFIEAAIGPAFLGMGMDKLHLTGGARPAGAP